MFAAMGFFAAAAGALNPAFGPALDNTSPVTGIRTVALSLLANGTATANSVATDNWALPAYAGVGALWWVRFTFTGANLALNSGTAGAWLALAAGGAISLRNTLATNEGIGTLKVEFSRDGGASVAGTYFLSVDVGYQA